MAISPQTDPLALFQQWFAEAQACKAIEEPTALTLATADADGAPDARIVLLKHCDARGFVIYTNLGSAKAEQLRANPRAALCFHWMPLEKQVRIRGAVEPVSDDEADAYYHSRPKLSRIGAWASRQSEPLPSRFALEKRVARFAARFALGDVPRPEFWSGFRLVPHEIEFWLKQDYRLHDRLLYTRTGEAWTHQRLYP
jgi:pyridoxamine 5'-phosphate oxidase